MEYIRKYVLDKKDLEDLIEYSKVTPSFPSSITKNIEYNINPEYSPIYSNRRTSTQWKIQVSMWTEINTKIESIVNDGTKVNQLDFLHYGVGGRFKKHKDVNPNLKRFRTWSSSTLINKSNDVTGGELILYEGDNKKVIDLQVGETVLFPSFMTHEVSEVIIGERMSLVGWLN